MEEILAPGAVPHLPPPQHRERHIQALQHRPPLLQEDVLITSLFREIIKKKYQKHFFLYNFSIISFRSPKKNFTEHQLQQEQQRQEQSDISSSPADHVTIVTNCRVGSLEWVEAFKGT